VLPSGFGGLVYRLRDRWLARVAANHEIEAPGIGPSIAAPPSDARPDEIPLGDEPVGVHP
jgi:hypothetical protein